jgi:hypothetical protein
MPSVLSAEGAALALALTLEDPHEDRHKISRDIEHNRASNLLIFTFLLYYDYIFRAKQLWRVILYLMPAGISAKGDPAWKISNGAGSVGYFCG